LVEGLTGVMMVIAGTLIDKSDISNPVERLFQGLTGIIEGVIDELTFPIDQKSRLMQMLKSLIDR
jgi:hypothetical protein